MSDNPLSDRVAIANSASTLNLSVLEELLGRKDVDELEETQEDDDDEENEEVRRIFLFSSHHM